MSHRCRTGDACPSPGWLSTGEPFCPQCYDDAAEDIGDLVADYLTLAANLHKGGGAGIDETRDPNKPESTPPLNLHADVLMRRIVWMVAAWEYRVLDAIGEHPAPYRHLRPGFLTARATITLSKHITDLAALPLAGMVDVPGDEEVYLDGIDGVNRLRALHATCRAYLGLTEKKIRLPGDCPGCGGLTLTRYDGGDRVACDLCKRSWPYPEYQRYVSLMTEMHDDDATSKSGRP